ncbi:MAG: DUF378 domain-containing protein [Candidatus Aenigmatarchaeota archaeon]
MAKKTALQWAVFVLIVVGGLNWGLVGLLGLDVIQAVFGSVPMLVKAIYVLVGLAALYKIYIVASK